MQTIDHFKRYEIKYILSKEQYKLFRLLINNYAIPDEYGESTILNIYYDTPDYRLIRHCILEPSYKEKMRLRCYSVPQNNTKVFLELKKKYDSIVYKRRVCMNYADALQYINNPTAFSQITKELQYVFQFYSTLQPAVFLSYERKAFVLKDDNSFRITIDKNILWRNDDINLQSGIYGEDLLQKDTYLVEIKTSTAIPLWLTTFFSQQKLYKTSFSKYRKAYEQLLKEVKGDYICKTYSVF